MDDFLQPDAKDDESPTTKSSNNRRSIYEVDSDSEVSPGKTDYRRDSKDDVENIRVVRNGRPARGNTKENEEPKAFVPKNVLKTRRSFSNESESKTDLCGDTNSDVDERRNDDNTKSSTKKDESKSVNRESKTDVTPFYNGREPSNRRPSEVYSDDDEDSVDDDRHTDVDDESSLTQAGRGPPEQEVYAEVEPSFQSQSNSGTTPTVSSPRSPIRGSYSEFLKRNQSMGIALPRKSGRYDDTEDQRFPTNLSQDANEALIAVYNGPDEDISQTYEVNKMLSPQNASLMLHATNKISFAMIAQPRGFRTDLVQCTIIRRGKLYPTYELLLEDPKKVLIVAQKMNLNRTSNYHLFDMTRGQGSSKLSKKNGNYLGKLRARNASRTEYALLNKSSDREELAGIAFDRLRLVDQLKEGNQPRKMKLIVPATDSDSVPVPHRIRDNDTGSLTGTFVVVNNFCFLFFLLHVCICIYMQIWSEILTCSITRRAWV